MSPARAGQAPAVRVGACQPLVEGPSVFRPAVSNRDMRSAPSALPVVAVLAILALAPWQSNAQQVPGTPLVPPGAVAGGRGPNPMTGLAGLVETPTTGPDAPRFEVASVKRNALEAVGGNPGNLRGLAGGGFRATNATLRMLIRSAYRLSLTDDIIGGPSWIDKDGFDVDARPAKPVTLVESAYMLRTLLADRFKLEVRRESRAGPVYALVLARSDGALGPQIKRPAGECVMSVPAFARTDGAAGAKAEPARFSWPAPGRPGRRCGVGPDGDTIRAGSATMATLVTFLTPLVDRPVVDKSGLPGAFDFDLRFDTAATSFLARGRGAAVAVSPDTPSDPGKGPSIFTALQEQLGLKLEPQRGAVDVLAVRAAELPTEN